MSKLKVTLKKSRIGRIEKHIKNVDALGLKKIGDVVEIEDTPANRGKINQVAFMLDVEEVK
ncbi:50S ribosomal protein L30 [Miniphocaeibacter halophilus]|uniref:50S ribosomal protein L30 n=1 Tax=Miniphocaeibacter halophilus TaxID=2931922 RepID=A0AC61MQ41_9FIRM|nr:50S ribosomal protein L30 [Miniphocaeibacter halophilus]QQK07064.1 50S ribosomal protein L30 [Miniphocaeibacter halophilus]